MPSTKDRLITAMQRALTTSGYRGTGLTALLAEAGAPKGVLYHHFPGGKRQLAVAAVEALTERILANLEASLAATDSPLAAFDRWLCGASVKLSKSGFAMGCPLATITLETAHEEPAIQAAVHTAFARIRTRLAQALRDSGTPETQAENQAALFIASYEGALLVARADRDTAVLTQTLEAMRTLLLAR